MRDRDIAIIGLACRFPSADNYEEYFNNLIRGVDSVKEIPKNRWDSNIYTPKTKWVGLLDDFESFDNKFFKMSPRETEFMDPQQKLILQEAWRCIEDSGVSLKELQSKKTAVYISYFTTDNRNKLVRNKIEPSNYILLGNCDSNFANRISFIFDLTGESLSINAACAGGLVAINQAKKGILSGECDYAIVGGVNINIDMWKYMSLESGHMLSEEGRCKAFSNEGNGYVPGDGVAAVLLQKAVLSEKDDNNIYGIIKGTAVNHTGKNYSITAPKINSQKKVILEAIKDSEVEVEKISYLEAHGTGTSLGDPIEIAALSQAFGEYTNKKSFCNIGSVKSNIGHLESVSGLASLIKVLMMFKNAKIPPLINMNQVNPIIDFENSPFIINTTVKDWNSTKRIAGISSFGFSGVNSHIIVEEYIKKNKNIKPDSSDFFIISAQTEKSLNKLVDKWIIDLRKGKYTENSINDICRTLQMGRENFKYRICVKIESADELLDVLTRKIFKIYTFSDKETSLCVSTKKFNGYSQLRGLFERYPVFNDTIGYIFKNTYKYEYEEYIDEYYKDNWNGNYIKRFNLLTNYGLYLFMVESKIEANSLVNNSNDNLLILILSKVINLSDALDFIEHGKEIIEINRPSMDIYIGDKCIKSNYFLCKSDLIGFKNLFIESYTNLDIDDKAKVISIFSKTTKLYKYQLTFNKNLKQWINILQTYGLNLEFYIMNYSDVKDEYFTIEYINYFIACIDSLFELYKKWDLNIDLTFNNKEMNTAIKTIKNKLLKKSLLIKLFCIDINSWKFDEAIELNYENYKSSIFYKKINEEEKTEILDYIKIFNPNNQVELRNQDLLKLESNNELLVNSIMEILIQAWSLGKNINWNHVNKQCKYNKVPLPTYCFQSKKDNENILTKSEISMSEIEQALPSIDEHIINGEIILPAAFFIEYIFRYSESNKSNETISLNNITWCKSFKVKEAKSVGIKLGTNINNKQKFKIISDKTGYVYGSILNEKINTNKTFKIPSERIIVEDKENIYMKFKNLNYDYGEKFRIIENIEIFKNMCIGNLDVSNCKFVSYYEKNVSIIDSCLQVAIIFGVNAGIFSSMVLPYNVEKISSIGEIPDNVKILVEKGLSNKNNCLNIYILDENDKAIMEFINFKFLNYKDKNKSSSLEIFEPKWVATNKSIKNIKNNNTKNNNTIIFNYNLGENINTIRFNEIYDDFIVINPSSIYKENSNNSIEMDIRCDKHFDMIYDTLRHRKSIFEEFIYVIDSDLSLNENNYKCESLVQLEFFNMVKKIKKVLKDRKYTFKIITIGYFKNPTYSSLGAFVRTVNFESTRFKMNLIQKKLDSSEVKNYNRIFNIAIEDRGIEEVLINDKNVFLERKLIKVNSGDLMNKNLKVKGIYLITGGMGGIGLNLAKFLSKEYKSTIIILGRSQINENINNSIREIKSLGGDAKYFSCDIGNEEKVKTILDNISKGYLQLNGIFHCAGIIRDNFIDKKSDSEFNDVIEAKVKGSMNLIKSIKNIKIDFLILFSSVVSLWGNPGQVDYAVGNRFMDDISRIYDRRDKRVISINWPLCKDGGMKISNESEKFMERLYGITTVRSQDIFSKFDEILNLDSSNFLVVNDDYIINENKNCIGNDIYKYFKIKEVCGIMTNTMDEDKRRLQVYIVDLVAKILKVDKGEIDIFSNMSEYGFESLSITEFINNINEKYDLTLTPAVFFENSTIDEMIVYLLDEYGECFKVENTSSSHLGLNRNSDNYVEPEITILEDKKDKPENNTNIYIDKRDDYKKDGIAIIGITGVFPGAKDIDELYTNLLECKDVISYIPKERWDFEKYYGNCNIDDNKTMVNKAGFCRNFDKFDNDFWNISPKEALLMDPQQRIILEEIINAYEDAGYNRSSLANEKVGVFIGATTTDYSDLINKYTDKVEAKTPLSNYHCLIANRISYLFDFTGPSEAIDTACSSSLVAIHRAIEAIKNGECNYAFVAGVNVLASVDTFISFDKSGMLSKSCVCNSFDENADGYVRGEGVGVILIKPLSSALKDKDYIYGIIKGSAVNHGGKTSGITVPNPNAQSEVIYEAWKAANVNPSTISYIEAHGTGTKLGDPIEINGLKMAFERLFKESKESIIENSCAIGTIKANIGHTEAASGIAGLIKILLQMKNRKLLKVNNFKKLNPYIKLENSPFYILDSNKDWDTMDISTPLRAGVSSFGFGGVNAHIALESYENDERVINERRTEIFIFSAKNKDSLIDVVKGNIELIKSNHKIESFFNKYSYSLKIHKEQYEHRLGILANSIDELLIIMEGFINGEESNCYVGNAKSSSMKDILNCDLGMELLSSIIKDKKNEKIVSAWVNGINIDWKDYYLGERTKRIKLSKYPFNKKRFWIESLGKISNINLDLKKEISYEDEIVKNHIVNDNRVVPGMYYLFIVRDELIKRDKNLPWTFKNINFINILQINKHDVTVRIEILVNNGKGKFKVFSEDKETVYAIGNIEHAKSDFDLLVPECNFVGKRTLYKDEIYKIFTRKGIKYHDKFERLNNVALNDKEAVAILDDLDSQDESYDLVTILDAAIQSSLLLIKKENSYVPFEIQEICLNSHIKDVCKSHVVLESNNVFNIQLFDNNSILLGIIRGLALRKVDNKTKNKEYKLLTPIWENSKVEILSKSSINNKDKVVIISDKNNINEVMNFQEKYSNLFIYYINEDIDLLLNSINDCNKVIFLSYKAKEKSSILSEEDFKEIQDKTIGLLFKVLKAMYRVGLNNRNIDINLITFNTFEIKKDDKVNPFGSAMIGLIRSVCKESKRWNINIFDIDDNFTEIYINIIEWINCKNRKGNNLFGIRDCQLYFQKMIPTFSSKENHRIGMDEVTVIVGGFGGLGLEITKNLVKNYKNKVIIIGRSRIDEKKKNVLNEISSVEYLQCDITNILELERVINTIISKYGVIDRVIHSALVLKDGILQNMELEQLMDVLNPKTIGVFNLSKVLKQYSVKNLILFSSAQSFMNFEGQSNYSAASLFEDQYAKYIAQNYGINCKVINWGLWGKVGVVATDFYEEYMNKKGLMCFEPNEGVAAFEDTMGCFENQIVAIKIKDEFMTEYFNNYEIDKPKNQLDIILGNELINTNNVQRILKTKELIKYKSYLFAKEIIENNRDSLNEFTLSNNYQNLVHEIYNQVEEMDNDRTSYIEDNNIDGSPYVDILDSIKTDYKNILTGKKEATSVLFSKYNKELIAKVYGDNTISNYCNAILKYIVQYKIITKIKEGNGNKNRKIRIIELGGGTGGTTVGLLNGLQGIGEHISYCFSDISRSFIVNAMNKFNDYDFMEYKVINIEQDFLNQNIEENYFDIVLATNVVHATKNIDNSILNINKILKKDGVLILNELTNKELFNTLVFGLLDGWWCYEDDNKRIDKSPLLTKETWKEKLKNNGFKDVNIYGDIELCKDIGQNIIIAIKEKKYNLPKGINQDLIKIDIKPEIMNDTLNIEIIIKKNLEKCLNINSDEFELDTPFSEFGVDSILAIEIIEKINEELKINLKTTDLFNYATIRNLKSHIETLKNIK